MSDELQINLLLKREEEYKNEIANLKKQIDYIKEVFPDPDYVEMFPRILEIQDKKVKKIFLRGNEYSETEAYASLLKAIDGGREFYKYFLKETKYKCAGDTDAFFLLDDFLDWLLDFSKISRPEEFDSIIKYPDKNMVYQYPYDDNVAETLQVFDIEGWFNNSGQLKDGAVKVKKILEYGWADLKGDYPLFYSPRFEGENI